MSKHTPTPWNVLPLFFLALTLFACERKTVERIVSGGPAAPVETQSFIGAGQSNMFLMDLQDGFRRELAVNGYASVTTENVAVTSTYLDQWQKGTWMYTNLVSKARYLHESGHLSAILFWQGENEGLAPDPSAALNWADRFSKLIDDLRGDIGIPDLKIVFVQIGKRYEHGENWDVVKAQQASVSRHNVIMVKSDDLEANDDHLHYSRGSYNSVGQRMADAIK